MRVRTRLLLAFAYILIVVIVALEVPLAFNLNRRALAELEARALVQAQAMAGAVEEQELSPANAGVLQRLAAQVAEPGVTRVIVTDAQGALLADSDSPGTTGASYENRPEIQRVLAGEPFVQVTRFSTDLGQDILATAVPVTRSNRLAGAVRITQSLTGVRAEVRRIVLGLAAVGLVGLAAGLAVAWVLAGTLSRPLTRLAGTAHRLGEGDLSARAGTLGSGEIADVAETFDAMAERLEATVRAQREFVANASHQLRTPLTGLKLRLEGAADAAPADLRHQIEAAQREADRLAGIVDRLLQMARSVEQGRLPAEADLGAVARGGAERWRERAARAGASIEVSGNGTSVVAAREDLDQILDNLIDNALAYAPGPLSIEVAETDGAGILAVADHGPGIPAEERAGVMERFGRGARTAPGGSGLGLAIVRELAGRWGGAVEIGERPGGGGRIEVRLPLAEGFTRP